MGPAGQGEYVMPVSLACAWCGTDFITAAKTVGTIGICAECHLREFPRRPQQADPTRCPRCGGFFSSRTLLTDEGLAQGVTCVACGLFQHLPQRPRRTARVMGRVDPSRVPCPVEGCNELMPSSATLCSSCNRLVREWERGAKRKPCPIREVNGQLTLDAARRKKKKEVD